jgi:hypothetical protein
MRALISSISAWRSAAGLSPPTKPMTPPASLTKYHGLLITLAVLVVEPHVDEHVARIELANLGGFLAALDLGYDFRGQQHLGDEVLEFLCLFELLDVGLHLVLLAGEGVEREPLGRGGSLGGHREAELAADELSSPGVDHVVEGEIADAGEEAEEQAGDDHDDRRVRARSWSASWLSAAHQRARWRRYGRCGTDFSWMEIGRWWQGRRDSNPQPTVLETATLPIELHPCGYDTISFRRHSRGPQRSLGSVGRKRLTDAYSTISVTRPAPMVRPPSRMANFWVFSMAIGTMSSMSTAMLSPGMIISTPFGRLTTPVTSVVRK